MKNKDINLAQELSNQIPIFAALAMPTGLTMIGTSSFGDQYSNLVAEERSLAGRKLSDQAKWWMSLGHGASEVVFEGLTTLPLIRAAKNSFRGTQGATTLFDTNVKKYFIYFCHYKHLAFICVIVSLPVKNKGWSP